MDDSTTTPEQTKPLNALYGKGTGLSTVDRESETWEPLLLAIESAIVDYCNETGSKPSGGSILLTVKDLGMNPESPTVDAVGKAIQDSLRWCLSKHNYSRQDVKMALKAIARSVDMHTRDGGVNGYLDFIRKFLK